MVKLHLSGLGTAVPPGVLKQTDAAEASRAFCAADARQARALRMLYGRSGVETRNTVVVQADQGTLQERVPRYPAASGPEDRGPPRVSAWPGTKLKRRLWPRRRPAGPGGRLHPRGCHHPSGHGIVHGLLLPGSRRCPHRHAGTAAYGASHPRRIHGVPRGPQRAAGGRVAGGGSGGAGPPLCC